MSTPDLTEDRELLINSAHGGGWSTEGKTRAQRMFLASYRPFIDALKEAVPADERGNRSWPLGRWDSRRPATMDIEKVELTEGLLEVFLPIGVDGEVYAPLCLHPHIEAFCRAWKASFPDEKYCLVLGGPSSGITSLRVITIPAGCLARYESCDGLETVRYVDASDLV